MRVEDEGDRGDRKNYVESKGLVIWNKRKQRSQLNETNAKQRRTEQGMNTEGFKQRELFNC